MSVNEPTALEQTPASAPAQTKPKRSFKMPLPKNFLKPGTFSHAALWTEKSGGTLCVILGLAQWAFPLHGADPSWLLIAVNTIVAVWYPSAQANGVQRAMNNQGTVDPKQINRDYSWSVAPMFVIFSMWGLTLLGLGLDRFTPLFEDPSLTWLRDRMILSPIMAFNSVIAYFAIRADLGNNSTILSEMTQLTGRLMRFERAEH